MSLKFCQNSKGIYKGYKYVSTMTELLVFTDEGIVKVGVRRAKDFDIDALMTFAVGKASDR